MEEVANRMMRYLYDHLADAHRERATALVRFFITRPYSQLDDNLHAHTNNFPATRQPTHLWNARPC